MIANELKIRNEFVMPEFIVWIDTPLNLYTVCTDLQYVLKLKQTLKSFYLEESIKELIDQTRFTIRRTSNTFMPEVNLKKSGQFW